MGTDRYENSLWKWIVEPDDFLCALNARGWKCSDHSKCIASWSYDDIESWDNQLIWLEMNSTLGVFV